MAAIEPVEVTRQSPSIADPDGDWMTYSEAKAATGLTQIVLLRSAALNLVRVALWKKHIYYNAFDVASLAEQTKADRKAIEKRLPASRSKPETTIV